MMNFLRFHEEFHQAQRCLKAGIICVFHKFFLIFKTSSNVAQVDYEQSCGWNSNSVRAEGILKKSRPAFSSSSSRPTTLDQLAFSKHENRLNFSYNNVIIPITKHDPPFTMIWTILQFLKYTYKWVKLNYSIINANILCFLRYLVL